MSGITAIAIVQALSFAALAILFATHHNWRLAVAQACYVVTTIVIFAR